jgi:hypothetical protein
MGRRWCACPECGSTGAEAGALDYAIGLAAAGIRYDGLPHNPDRTDIVPRHAGN